MSLEGGESFSFKIIIDPNQQNIIDFVVYDSDEVLYSHLEKSIEY